MTTPLLPLLLACTAREAPPGVLEELTIESESTGDSYDIEVFTPDALGDVAGATVVYAFDGPENQPRFLDAYRLALADGAEPAVLVLVPGTRRLRDFTPTPNPAGTNGGGSAAFIDFVIDELAPIVEADGAGGSPEARVTFGHSLGGLLSGTFWYDHAFATRAGIASPSFWWDEGRFFSKLAEAPVNPGPIVVTCGEEEPMGMYVYTDDFSRQMQRDHGIDVTYRSFDGKSHQRALEPAIALTLRELL